MPDHFDEIEARFGGAATADAAPSRFDEIEAKVGGAPEADAAPMDFETKRRVLRGLAGGDTAPGGTDLTYADTENPRYRHMIDVELDRAVPGARTQAHAAALLAKFPEPDYSGMPRVRSGLESPTFARRPDTSAGDVATTLAKRAAHAVTSPPAFLGEMLLGKDRYEQLASEHLYAPGSGVGLSPEREAVARQAIEESGVGRAANMGVDLLGQMGSFKTLGRGLGAIQPGGMMASSGTMAIHGGLTGGGEGFGGGAIFGALAHGIEMPLGKWIERLPPGLKGAAVERLANAGAGGVSFAGADAVMNGPDAERAIANGIFGGALGFGKALAKTEFTKGEDPRLTAARGAARIQAEAEARKAAHEEAVSGEFKPGEPVEVTMARGQRVEAEAAERGAVVAKAIETGLVPANEAASPERVAAVSDAKSPEEARAILESMPAEKRPDGTISGPTLPYAEARAKGLVAEDAVPLADALEASGGKSVTHGHSAETGEPWVVGTDARGEVVRVDPVPEAPAAPREEVIQPRAVAKPRLKSADTLEAEATKNAGLAQHVRKFGGLKGGSAEGLAGELEMLRTAESGTTGLLRRGGKGKTIEEMMDSARESGFDIPPEMTPAEFVDAVLADAQGKRTLNPAEVDAEKLGAAALRRQAEQESARWETMTPEERIDAEENMAVDAEARGEMADADTSFDFGFNAPAPKPPAPVEPGFVLVGKTNKGKPVYRRQNYREGDPMVIRGEGGRMGAAHPTDVKEAKANALAEADRAASAANIDAAVAGIRGGKPARVPKTARGGQAGIGNPLEIAATLASLPRKAIGAAQQGEKWLVDRARDVLSKVADASVRGGMSARDFLGIAKERLEPHVMGREMRNRIDEVGYERAAAKMDAGEAFKGLKVTDPETAERITEYFEGKATQDEAHAALDPKSRDVLEWAANQRDVNERELIDLGVLTQEMVDNLKGGGRYATRTYEKILEGAADQQGIVSHGKRIPKMWKRTDISPERRVELGEIRDPRVVIATTLAKQGSLLPMARLFRDVAENPRQASTEGGEGWTREPLPNQPTRYGKLAGMYVRRPFKKWLDSVQGERTATDAVADVINGWVADWKFGAVSGRPASLLRDVMSNLGFGEFSNRSHFDLTNLVDDAGAIRIMRSKPGTPEYDLLKRFVEKGVTDGSSFEPDTLKMLDEVESMGGKTFPNKVKAYVREKLSAAAHLQINRAIPGTEIVARVRQLQDAFFRVRALHHDIRKGASVDEAIAQVRLDYPYFGGNVAGAVMRQRGLAMAALRAAGPIPPFLNFMEWGAKWAMRQAINRPATSMALIGGLSAMSTAVAKMAGLSDEDRRRMEAAIPSYRRPGILRPMVAVNDGNPTVIDLSYVIPMGNELETAISTVKALTGSSDEIDDDGMRGLPVGPAMALFAQIGMNKKMFSDTPINTSQDPAFGKRESASEGRRQMLRYVAEGMIPTVRDVTKFYRALKGVPLDSKGKIKPDVLLTALDTFAGVKIRTSDTATDRYHSLLNASQIIEEKLKGWEKAQNDPRIDPADLPEREREFAADIMGIYLKTLPFRVKGARNVVDKIESTLDADKVVKDLRGETNKARTESERRGK